MLLDYNIFGPDGPVRLSSLFGEVDNLVFVTLSTEHEKKIAVKEDIRSTIFDDVLHYHITRYNCRVTYLLRRQMSLDVAYAGVCNVDTNNAGLPDVFSQSLCSVVIVNKTGAVRFSRYGTRILPFLEDLCSWVYINLGILDTSQLLTAHGAFGLLEPSLSQLERSSWANSWFSTGANFPGVPSRQFTAIDFKGPVMLFLERNTDGTLKSHIEYTLAKRWSETVSADNIEKTRKAFTDMHIRFMLECINVAHTLQRTNNMKYKQFDWIANFGTTKFMDTLSAFYALKGINVSPDINDQKRMSKINQTQKNQSLKSYIKKCGSKVRVILTNAIQTPLYPSSVIKNVFLCLPPIPKFVRRSSLTTGISSRACAARFPSHESLLSLYGTCCKSPRASDIDSDKSDDCSSTHHTIPKLKSSVQSTDLSDERSTEHTPANSHTQDEIKEMSSFGSKCDQHTIKTEDSLIGYKSLEIENEALTDSEEYEFRTVWSSFDDIGPDSNPVTENSSEYRNDDIYLDRKSKFDPLMLLFGQPLVTIRQNKQIPAKDIRCRFIFNGDDVVVDSAKNPKLFNQLLKKELRNTHKIDMVFS